jgi:hypothetical protein
MKLQRKLEIDVNMNRIYRKLWLFKHQVSFLVWSALRRYQCLDYVASNGRVISSSSSVSLSRDRSTVPSKLSFSVFWRETVQEKL